MPVRTTLVSPSEGIAMLCASHRKRWWTSPSSFLSPLLLLLMTLESGTARHFLRRFHHPVCPPNQEWRIVSDCEPTCATSEDDIDCEGAPPPSPEQQGRRGRRPIWHRQRRSFGCGCSSGTVRAGSEYLPDDPERCVTVDECQGFQQQQQAPPPTTTTTTDATPSVPCPVGLPLVDRVTGDEVFCGRGTDRNDCPPGWECVIAPDDAYAVCCEQSENDTPLTNPCAAISCRTGYACDPEANGGRGGCVPAPDEVPQTPGTPLCYFADPTDNPCARMLCPEGTTCDPNLNNCRGDCRADTEDEPPEFEPDEKDPDEPPCTFLTPNDNPCTVIECKPGYTCDPNRNHCQGDCVRDEQDVEELPPPPQVGPPLMAPPPCLISGCRGEICAREERNSVCLAPTCEESCRQQHDRCVEGEEPVTCETAPCWPVCRWEETEAYVDCVQRRCGNVTANARVP